MTHRYVALSDNEKTGYKARELKSVHVDAVGTFVKFVIHKNHVNRHNIYNQVSQWVGFLLGFLLSKLQQTAQHLQPGKLVGGFLLGVLLSKPYQPSQHLQPGQLVGGLPTGPPTVKTTANSSKHLSNKLCNQMTS